MSNNQTNINNNFRNSQKSFVPSTIALNTEIYQAFHSLFYFGITIVKYIKFDV